jgi:hypothetical protein
VAVSILVEEIEMHTLYINKGRQLINDLPYLHIYMDYMFLVISTSMAYNRIDLKCINFDILMQLLNESPF